MHINSDFTTCFQCLASAFRPRSYWLKASLDSRQIYTSRGPSWLLVLLPWEATSHRLSFCLGNPMILLDSWSVNPLTLTVNLWFSSGCTVALGKKIHNWGTAGDSIHLENNYIQLQLGDCDKWYAEVWIFKNISYIYLSFWATLLKYIYHHWWLVVYMKMRRWQHW